jgi:hypothetical protein
MLCRETARLGALIGDDLGGRKNQLAFHQSTVWPLNKVWPWNQATVAATASRNGVAVQPKVRSNLVLSTTQGRCD